MIHPLGTMNVNILCQSIKYVKLVQATNVNLLAGREDKSGDHKSKLNWGPRIFIQNSTAIHPIGVELVQSGPKWWTDRPADRSTL